MQRAIEAVDMILGLKGLKGSGKDTVAAYLIKQHSFERRAFADPLKKSVAALLDIPYHEIDKWKNDPDRVVTVHSIPPSLVTAEQQLTFREFLQRYGTESHRDIFGKNFWLDYTLPVEGFYSGRKIVVTDCRFENEARRINRVGGFVVQVHRPGLKDKDQHSSESLWPAGMVDYQLENDNSIDQLYEKIETMLTQLGNVERRI
jgi:Deoxynucleotide monophosphate kinase